MFKLIMLVGLMAFVLVFACKEMGQELMERGSRKLGLAVIASGILGGTAILLGFAVLLKNVEQVPYIAMASAAERLSLPRVPEPFTVHVPEGCIVYFKTDANDVRPVKSTGEGIAFERGEKTAVYYGKKCNGPVKVKGPRKVKVDVDPLGVTISLGG